MQARKVRTLHQPFSSRSTFYETQSRSFTYSKDSNQHRVYTYVAVSGAVLYRGDIILLSRHLNAGGEAVSKRKPRSERRGWEISFKQALLLRAEGGIRPFFVGHCRGDTVSNVRNVAITRRRQTHFPLPLWLRLVPLTYRAWKTARRSATHAHTCRLSRPKVRCGGS